MESANGKTMAATPSPNGDMGIGDRGTHSAYIAVQSVGSLLRNCVTLYRTNFGPLFFAYVLPTFPFLLVQHAGQLTHNHVLEYGGFALSMIASTVTIGAINLTIADICLGNTPGVGRSYRKLMQGGLWLRLLLTTVWQLFLTALGTLCLIVPGIFLGIRLSFTPSVVVLEGLSGNSALKRSYALSEGHFWRLAGFTTMLFTVFYVAPIFVFSLLGGVFGYFGAKNGASLEEIQQMMVIPSVVMTFLMLLIFPLFFIGLVLLYYDIRVRKEAYDIAALSEDMMR